jgi:hypothetical protein
VDEDAVRGQVDVAEHVQIGGLEGPLVLVAEEARSPSGLRFCGFGRTLRKPSRSRTVLAIGSIGQA